MAGTRTHPLTSLELEDLAARFASCTLPKEEWTHQAHLTVGMWHVERYGADAALERLRTGIRRLNDSHGTPNTESRGYHETITRAYVMVLAEFLAACPDEMPLAERVTRLLASPVSVARAADLNHWCGPRRGHRRGDGRGYRNDDSVGITIHRGRHGIDRRRE